MAPLWSAARHKCTSQLSFDCSRPGLPLVTKWSAVKSAASAVSAPRVKRKKRERVQGRGRGQGEEGQKMASSFLFSPGMAEAFPPRGRKPIKPGCPAARMYRKWNCSRKCLYYLSRVKIPSAVGFFMNKKDLPPRPAPLSPQFFRWIHVHLRGLQVSWCITFLIIHRVKEYFVPSSPS